VSSRAQYEYFGIDVDAIGLGTQEYIMRSPQPLLVPLLLIALLGVAGLTLNAYVRRRVAAAVGAPQAASTRLLRYALYTARVLGLLVAGAGIALMASYGFLRDWAFYSLVTPLLIAAGAGVAMYARRIAVRMKPQPKEPKPEHDTTSAALRRTTALMGYLLIAASVFWATATLAEWTGRGRGQEQARHLDRLPRVILDTKERLFLRSPGVDESVLPPEEGQTFHYRYRNLRLLIVGHDRMFLVPEHWSASNTTLVVPIDGSARVQFQFVNQAP
jgi:hypothetical protein